MSNSTTRRYLVLSDLHFGTYETSLNNPLVVQLLADYMSDRGPWDEVIFSGDLLDLNLSTVTKSIEGDTASCIVGFRSFIKELTDSKGLSVGNWVYIPGNHDYFIWDSLSSKVACYDVLAAGKPMGTVPTPLMSHAWRGRRSYYSGIFPELEIEKVVVEYPDHVISFGDKKMVITHGHYLDASQTQLRSWWNSIKPPVNPQDTVHKMFIETAQYQAMAHAISYTSKTRRFANWLFGPENILDKIKRFPGVLFGKNAQALLRDKPVDLDQLMGIEFFLRHFQGYIYPPDYFIFGHTHCQAESFSSLIPMSKRLFPQKEIQVFNAGSFFKKDDTLATFIVIKQTENENPKVHLCNIDRFLQVHAP
jgi:hypothetical protein